jgi:hypothetical protein
VKLNLGCGRDHVEGLINVDLPNADPPPDLALDLNSDLATWLGAIMPPTLTPRDLRTDGAVEYAQMIHVLEHLPNQLAVMENLWWCSVPGGKVHIRCPHGASDDAWEDPTHVRPMFPHSFLYFGQPNYWRADYGYRGDWRVETMHLVTNGEIQPEQLDRDRNVVREIQVTLEAVKPARAQVQEIGHRLTATWAPG